MPVRRPSMLLAALAVVVGTVATGAGPAAAAEEGAGAQLLHVSAVAFAPCPADKSDQQAQADLRAAKAAAKRALADARVAATRARAQPASPAAQRAAQAAHRTAQRASLAMGQAARKAAEASSKSSRAKRTPSCTPLTRQ